MHVDEQHIVYPAGHNVVHYALEEHKQQFLSGFEGTLAITCMCISASGRFLAMGEKSDRAVAFVFDLHTMKRRKNLTTSDILSQQFVSMAFHPFHENKTLITMGGEPDWMLVLWNWDRSKVNAITKVSTTNIVRQVSFNPYDINGGIVCSGDNILRWYKHLEGNLKIQTAGGGKKDSAISSNYKQHIWMTDGKLLMITENDDILVYDQNIDFKGLMHTDMEGWDIGHAVAFSKGVLIGGSKATAIVFEKNSEDIKALLQKSQRTIVVPDQGEQNITNMSVQPGREDHLIVLLNNMQLFITPFSSDRPGEDTTFTHLVSSFHYGNINGMDVAQRKALLATCGSDKTVRVWNYLDNSLEVSETFKEESFSVAFHPSGFNLVVGFADRLRIMNVFSKSIVAYKEIPIKACREVRFSHGGHMFAAANGHIIQVFKFYTFENPSNFQFKGHTSKIKSIAWNDDDLGFVSAGWDGAVFEWELYSDEQQQYKQEFYLKGTNFTSVAVTQDGARTIYSCSQDQYMREINAGECSRKLETGPSMGQILISNTGGLLIAGAANSGIPGFIRVYNFSPLTGDYTDYQAHSKPIERMRISNDDKYLFSAAQDGSICVFEVTDKSVRTAKDGPAIPYCDELIIPKAKIDKYVNKIESQNAQIAELSHSSQLAFDLAMKEKQHQITRLDDQLKQDEEADESRYMMLLDNKKTLENHYSERARVLEEQNFMDKKEMGDGFSKKLQIEANRYTDLSNFKNQLEEDFNEKIEKMKTEYHRTVAKMDSDQEKSLDKKSERISLLAREKQEMEQEFEMIRYELEEESEHTCEKVREGNQTDTKTEITRSHEARGNLKLMKKKHTTIKIQLDELKLKVGKKKDRMEEQQNAMRILKKEEQIMANEVLERDKTITDKQSRIRELKVKNMELEKFKFVLDYKIKELKKEIIPREQEISTMQEQTMEMEKELKHLNTVNENLKLMVDDLKMRQDGMGKEIVNLKEKYADRSNIVKLTKKGVFEAIQHLSNIKKLKESLLKIYNKYIKPNIEQADEGDDNIQVNYMVHRKYLETNISNLKDSLCKGNDGHRIDNNRIMRDNVELLNEINGLRKEYKMLSNTKKQVDFITQANSTLNIKQLDSYQNDSITTPKNVVGNLRSRINDFEQKGKKRTASLTVGSRSTPKAAPAQAGTARIEL